MKHRRSFDTARDEVSPLLSLFLFLLDFDNFLAFVEAAVGADRVREAHGTAVRAGGQVARLQGIVCAAHVAAALRVFALWMWGHSVFLLIYKGRSGAPPLHDLRLKRADYSGWREERQG